MFMKECGRIVTKRMDMESTITMEEVATKENGLTINKMESVGKFGLTELNIKECLKMESKKEKALFFGIMDVPMKVILSKIGLRGKGCINGRMGDNLKGNGKTIK